MVRANVNVTCECNSLGTSLPCNSTTGKCNCKPHVTGPKCNKCMTESWIFDFPDCRGKFFGIIHAQMKIYNIYR